MWTLAGLHSNRWLLPSDSETFTTINYFTSQKISWTWDSIDRNELQCVVFSPYIVHSIRRDNVTHFIINQIGKNHVTRCCLVTFLRLFLFAYFPTDQSEQKPPAMCGVFSLSARLHYKTAQAELKMVWSSVQRFPGVWWSVLVGGWCGKSHTKLLVKLSPVTRIHQGSSRLTCRPSGTWG